MRKLVSSWAKVARFNFQNPKFYTKGLSYYRKENWAVAKENFEKALAEDSKHAPSLFKLGMCHFRQKHYEDALRCIVRALQVDPSQTQWQNQLDQTVRHVSKSAGMSASKREQLLREQLDYLDNPSAELYNQLAHALRKQGKWWQEIEVLKNATTLESKHPTWFFRLAEAQETMSRFQQAAHSFSKAIALKKEKADAYWYYRLGFCYQHKGHDGPANPAQAKTAYQEAINKDDKLHAKRFGIGVFHQQRGHWPQARDAYSVQLERGPWDAELNYRLAMAHDRCYEWAEAETYYKNALTINIEQPDWHYRLGFVLERQEKFDEAAMAYQFAALNRDRHTPYWFYRWGYVLEKQGRHREAVDAYLQTRLQPTLEGPEPLEQRGLSQTDFESSLTEYTQQFQNQRFVLNTLIKQLEKDTTDPQRWYQLGNAYELEREWGKAANAYQQAVMRQNTHTPDWYYRLGYALAKCHCYDKAAQAFRETRLLKRPYGVSEKQFKENMGFREAALYKEFYVTQQVEEKTVLYESYFGKMMSCNPFGVFCHLFENEKYKDWLHIWVVNDLDSVKEEYKKSKNVIFVKKGSDAYLKYLTSTKILINNSTFPPYFVRKEEQKYLNTWHGTPWKTLGKDIKSSFMEHKNTQRNFLQTTHIISPNSHTTKILSERYDITSLNFGGIYETGYPRIDLTVNADELEQQTLKRSLGILDDKPVILFAPTWRGVLGKENTELDEVQSVISALANNELHVLFRGHYFVEKSILQRGLNARVVSSDVDTNKLLSIVDCLVTDYSSIGFDYLVTNKPIVYYLSDYEEYMSTRGLYFGVDQLPGNVVATVSELKNVVSATMEIGKPHTNYHLAKETFSPYEDGHAASRVVSLLFDEICLPGVKKINLGKKEKNILSFGGEFQPNGITTSFVNLLNNIDLNEVAVNVVMDPTAVSRSTEQLEQFSRIPQNVNIIPRVGRMNRTIEESWLETKFNQYNSLPSPELWMVLKEMYSHEFSRMFGRAKVDAIINFPGYSAFWTYLLGSVSSETSTRKTVFQHNDKYGEWASRFPNLEKTFNLYKYYDQILSVSEKTKELNQAKLSDLFSIDPNVIDYCDNLQNPDEIVAKSNERLDEDDQKLFSSGLSIFVTLGRLSIEKDHEKLIRAFSVVLETKPDSRLLILGDGPLKSDLTRLINSLGLRNYVHLLGRRSNPFPILKRADCFVLSSNHEGQPMVLLEAMVLKKPILATDIVGSRSAIEGRSGHLVHNSVQGLADGMLAFMSGQLEFPEYNIDLYQKAALEMFYSKACGLGAEYV